MFIMVITNNETHENINVCSHINDISETILRKQMILNG